MIFLIINSALATLIDDPFLVPKQYTGTNACSEIANYLHTRHSLSAYRATNDGAGWTCELKAELKEGLFPFENFLRKSNFYLFNQQLSADHHTEEYLLCTPTSYAIATAKVSRFKNAQPRAQFYRRAPRTFGDLFCSTQQQLLPKIHPE